MAVSELVGGACMATHWTLGASDGTTRLLGLPVKPVSLRIWARCS